MMTQFTTTDDVAIYYETFGNQGEPLLFIHPPLMGHVVFKYQRHLESNYQVILMDLRGHGESTHSPENFSLGRHTVDILELIDHLALPKVTLVGYSAGGTIALDFALKYPHRVQHLILSGGFPKVATWLLKREFGAGILFMKKEKVDFLSWVLSMSHKITAVDQKELYQYGKLANPKVVLEFYQDSLHYNCVADLGKLAHIPILVLYGTRHSYIRTHAKYFLNHLPNVKIGFIDHGTHQLPTRFHEPFNHALLHFLKNEDQNL